MDTFITIIYVIVALVMVLSILLQSGKGGGLGSALGGGASQSVFGGGGGADFMGKLTQGFAATFMICAMYLAYASAHAGSDFLEGEDEGGDSVFETNEEINYERIGINPLELPTADEGKRMQAAAMGTVPAVSELPETDLPEDDVEAPEDPAEPEDADDTAESATTDDAAEDPAEDAEDPAEVEDQPNPQDRGDSPHSGKENLQDTSAIDSGEGEAADSDPEPEAGDGEAP